MLLYEFENYVRLARNYFISKYPNNKSDINTYMNNLLNAYNQYKTGINVNLFKRAYLFLYSLYNIMITKYELIPDLQVYANIIWIDKNNPYDKLQQYLSYYTYALPDYTTLLIRDTTNNNKLVPTDTYNTLISFLSSDRLNNELNSILTNTDIQNLLIDFALLERHGVKIEIDTNLKNLVTYVEYLGLKRFLEDFSYIKLPGLSLEDLK